MNILTKLNTWKKRRLYLKLYQHTNGAIIAKSERERLQLQDFAFTYGEVLLDPFRDILAQARPITGETFVDIGSGTGKAVIIAALFFDLQTSYGIELLPRLHQHSSNLARKLSNNTCNIHFFQNNFLQHDFSDANIIFINATGLFGQTWDKLLAKLEGLKAGVRVIITTKKLRSDNFSEIYTNQHLMSWGLCRVSIYQKYS